ncbi:NlpC/P60 family protein [Haloechinothrix sp. LS1_15]|nr:NlpC/P60 family protein [Haloechinothrix sp. LS1_15]
MVITAVTSQQRAEIGAIDHVSCEAMIGPTQPGQRSEGASQAANLNEEQLGVVSLIISIGQERDLPPRAWQIAIQAGMTESRLRNLPYGDRDSLGIFQMRPSMGWGTPEQVLDPPYQVNKFYDVMEGVPDWQNRRPGDVAQAVERSAFPDRYHDWESMAVHLVEELGEVDDPAGCGELDAAHANTVPPNGAAETAIRFALGERGKPYVWGATGPDAYDCSGLLLRAYEAAGVTMPRVSRDQYRAGAMLPVEQAAPGDLVFWAHDTSDPNTIHHVAMYIGDGEIVEAQQTGVPVHTRDISWDEDGLMAEAVRPGV